MTTGSQRKKVHFLSVLHLLALMGLVVWWGSFYWHYGPAKALLARAAAPTPTRSSRNPAFALSTSITRKSDAILAAARAGVGDMAAGGIVILLFAIASGVSVRRLEIWLQARSSGQAVALGATRLSDATLKANAGRGTVLK